MENVAFVLLIRLVRFYRENLSVSIRLRFVTKFVDFVTLLLCRVTGNNLHPPI